MRTIVLLGLLRRFTALDEIVSTFDRTCLLLKVCEKLFLRFR